MCRHAVPTEITTDISFLNGETTSVLVHTSIPDHFITLDLRDEAGEWQISNITCTHSPEGSAKAFYTWYLGTIDNRRWEGLLNAPAGRAYESHPLLSDAFVAQVNKTLESFAGGVLIRFCWHMTSHNHLACIRV